MARSTRRDTDFNIREALKRTRSQLLGAQESGRAALAGYEELTPQYNRAVERARNFQSTLTRDYNRYVQDRQEAATTYNQQLQQRYQTYQGAVQQGSGLERTFRSAEQELSRLGGIKDAAAEEANRLYGTYAAQYRAGTKTGQQRYEKYLGDLQAYVRRFTKDIETYQGELSGISQNIASKQQDIKRSQVSASNLLSGSVLGGKYILDSTNKVYQIFTEGNRYKGAREVASRSYYPTPIPGGTVTGSGYGSLTAVLGDMYKRGYAKSWTDTVYQQYQRGTIDYGSYRQAAQQAQQLSSMVQKSYDRISGFQKDIRSFQADLENKNRQIEIASGALSVYDKAYRDSLKDTGYVTRFAQQQSAGALRSYQNYLRDTYNPTVNVYNQYASGTYNPAAQAYQNFMGSGQVQRALQDYQSLQQDTGFVDRAASDTKAIYDASQQEYGRLQAAYEGITPQLNQYTEQAEAAKQQVLSLQGMTPGLQRSLAIDTEARKRGTRLGYRRSVLSQDFKRRGAAR